MIEVGETGVGMKRGKTGLILTKLIENAADYLLSRLT